jgi:putative intracellular protease/amidase
MKKVLFVLTSHDRLGDTGKKTGFYLSELTHPFKVLQDNGIIVDFVSPKGGEAPIDGVDLSDKENFDFLNNEENKKAIENTLRPDQIDCNDYVAIYFVGGHGTMWDLPDNSKIQEITAKIFEDGGVVAAVCHGPVGLVNVKLSDGSYLISDKNVSCFTNEEEKAVALHKQVPFLLESKMKERGGIHSKAENFVKHVVISGKLVTGQNPASAYAVGEEILKLILKK